MVTVRVVVLVFVLAAGCRAGAPGTVALPGDGSAVAVWVLGHGWHTAIAIRRAEVASGLWPEADDFPSATFVEVAWGDRDFYMASRPTAWMAIRAAMAGNTSVLHVVGLGGPIAAHFPGSEIVELRLSRRGFDAMVRFVSGEVRRHPDGRPVRLQRGLYGESWFYAARSTYHLSNTCNTWVARALQAGGLPVTPAGVMTAGGVMAQVRSVAASP